jgi:hypothetical protein
MSLSRRKTLVAAGLGLLASSFAAGSSQAQGVFCPASIPVAAGINLQLGECTNGQWGAFSNAAIASQALSDLSQSSTQDAAKATMAAISSRRTAEAERCPEGFARVDGVCRRVAARPFAPESDAPGAFRPTAPAAAAISAALLTDAYAAVPPLRAYAAAPALDPAVRIGIWAQAYGDYERRSGSGQGTGEFVILTLNAQSRTTTAGVLGGGDLTFRNLLFANDGLIAGVLAGFVSSDVTVHSSSISADPNRPDGFGTLKANLSGPSAGAYVSYFSGGFSADLAFKADFLDLDASFNDLLGFSNSGTPPLPPVTFEFSGSGKTRLNNYTTSGNLNYRFPMAPNVWIEPTAGFQYTRSDYGSGAADLGLADGSLLRLQGGARFGVESAWNTVGVRMVLTGLLYDNVMITGGALQNSTFGNSPLIISDEGKLRLQGIFALNFDFGNGLTSFVQADVRGGEDLFGAGGKGGVRFIW